MSNTSISILLKILMCLTFDNVRLHSLNQYKLKEKNILQNKISYIYKTIDLTILVNKSSYIVSILSDIICIIVMLIRCNL